MNGKVYLSGLLQIALILCACNPNEPTNRGNSISCDPESYELTTNGGEFVVTVKSTSAWSATADQKWVVLSPNSGQGDAFVNVGVSRGSAATATVLFSNGSGTATLKIGRGQPINTGETNTDSSAGIKDGVITNAVFEVNDSGEKVLFSQGNLQYQASTGTWRFAEHQYDIIGEDNKNISSTCSGWIDLFGWGTGSNPTLSTTNYSDYATFTDWGVNKISNGGNTANQWRTLSKDEWVYLFSGRANAASLRSQAIVNNVHGYIFLPDSWSIPSGVSFTANASNWTTNTYSTADWGKMEQNGAVFLPAAGDGDGTGVNDVGSSGCYWSSTPGGTELAYSLGFGSDFIGPQYYGRRYGGQSVRLVRWQ